MQDSTPAQQARKSANGSAVTNPMVVYGAPWCPDCWRVKHFLKDRRVPFHEINIEENSEGEEIVLRANDGRRRVPTLKIGDRYFACSPFNALQLAEELQIPLNKRT